MPSKRQPYLALCSLVVILLLGAAGCSQNQDPGPPEEPYIAVEVAPVGLGDISLAALVGGTVKAGGEVAVVARLGGEVSSLKVSLGDRVEKGDLLVSLEAPDVSLQVRQARDAVNSLREARDELQDIIDELEERFEEIGSDGDDPDPEEEDPANGDNDDPGNGDGDDNGEEGGQEEGPPPGDGDDEEEEEEIEVPGWLRDLLEDGGFTIDPALGLRQQLAALEAQLGQAERGLEMARLGQANLSVRAPVSGMVTFINVVQGAAVGPGSPLLMISGEGGYLVEANVLESLITLIHPGDPVQVDLPIAGRAYRGSVIEVAPAPIPNTRMYPVKVSFDPAESGRVLPGMFARVSFVTEASGETLVIPRSAVLQRPAGNTVYVVEGERARARLVTLGLQDGERVQVLSGLQAGESLVVRGQHYLDEGSRVKVVEGAGPSEGAES